jgi:hypothetical protein
MIWGMAGDIPHSTSRCAILYDWLHRLEFVDAPFAVSGR